MLNCFITIALAIYYKWFYYCMGIYKLISRAYFQLTPYLLLHTFIILYPFDPNSRKMDKS